MSDESPRAALGLDAAHDGDIRGIRRFTEFVHRELWSISVTPGLPEEIRMRVSYLSREAERTGIFLEGFLASKKEGAK